MITTFLVWTLNANLFITYLTDRSAYYALVAQGQACWVQIVAYEPRPRIQTAQPLCAYDPANTNDGHAHGKGTR